MRAALLISSDTALAHELEAALVGSQWSLQRSSPDSVREGVPACDVLVLDASEPEAWSSVNESTTPVLVILNEAPVLETTAGAEEVLLRPLRPQELLLRLERIAGRADGARSRRRYAETFASLALGIVVLGPDLEMVFANPRAYEIVGHRPETIARDGITQLLSPEDLPRIREALSNRQYPRSMDVDLLRRDGTRITCSCSFAPLLGFENHTVISFDDVTGQRETERELLKTMEFLESLIDASVDAIVATDMQQRVVLFNPTAEKISGRHVADVLGKLRLEDLLGRSSTELVTKRLPEPSHGGKGRLEPTMLDVHDVYGQRIPVQLSASLIYERGEPSAIVLIFADLRDRIRAEERLAEAQKKLAFTEKQGVLAELAGTAAHELNQPLTSMMAYAELLQRQSDPGSAPHKAAKVLIREAERMADIVRKIGKITRYETTAYVGHQKIFDLDRAADAPSDPGAKG